MGVQTYLDNYSPVGDITVMVMCLAIFALLAGSYIKKNRNSGLFINIVVYLMLAATADVIYHIAYNRVSDGNFKVVNIIRVVYHALLFSNLLLYVVYIVSLLELQGAKKRHIMWGGVLLYVSVIIGDIIAVSTSSPLGFMTDPADREYGMLNVFLFGYIAFLVVIVSLTIVFSRHIYKRVMFGFYSTIALSFLVLMTQGRHGQTSFTVVSFLPPTIAIMYLLHSNPVDAKLGAADIGSLEDTVSFYRRIGKDFMFTSFHILDFDHEGVAMPEEIRDLIRTTADRILKRGTLFKVGGGHYIFIGMKNMNPDYMSRVEAAVTALSWTLDEYSYNYRIVLGESIEEISRKNEYVSFIRDIEHRMEPGAIHIVDDPDISSFRENEYILSELADISRKRDLDDPRVLVFCQPVYSLKTGKYDTAETLMRLTLPDMGMVPPYKFIGLAEDKGFIHTLTEIILKKTCDEISKLVSEGYGFKRISINLSMLDLREDRMSDGMIKIIQDSLIPEEKIAFEITESQSEYDFLVVKNKINELREHGIKFYLDDFGTGYSNMERILELPFDIIKFDRSLVIASDSDERSEKMVGSLAELFAKLNYAVLYEGIENQEDEERCKHMSASYLQGYKYSKPIPIAQLREFFDKAG